MDPQQQQQRPISLRFETKRYWQPLQGALGVTQTGAAIILDICQHPEWCSYSRTARHYDSPSRYRNPLYTWRNMVGAVDHLAGAGLIHHAQQLPGFRGWQSAIMATPELVALCAEIVKGEKLQLARPREVILLRDKAGKLIDYKDTQAIDRMRARVARFNEAIAGANLSAEAQAITAPLVRIFNGSMKDGGRFYAMGTSWQNIKREARQHIQINGEPVAELDYKTLHPAILYAQAGATMPADCYGIDGWPRPLVKVALLILLNADTKQKARLAIAHHDEMGPLAERGSQHALQLADRLIDTLKVMHKPIAPAFHTGAALRLMNIDAEMAEAVMNAMLMKGIVVLPVHDSFLVQQSKRAELEEAMLDAAHKIGLWAVQIEAK